MVSGDDYESYLQKREAAIRRIDKQQRRLLLSRKGKPGGV
jgi:hypothetical protein